jgi:anti-sigma-K factor RskA
MSIHQERHLELAAGWVLGSLDPLEALEFEAHLAEGCDTCRAELARLEGAATLLAASAPPVRPAPAVKDRLMAEVRREAASRATAAPAPRSAPGAGRVIELRPARRSWATFAWAAAAALLAVVSMLSSREVNRLQGEATALRERVAKAEQQLAEEQRWAAVLGSPEARVAEMAATPGAAGALRARATFDPRSRSAVIVFEGLQAPSDRDFELWAMRGGQVASLGLIHPDADGKATLRIEVAGDPATLAAFAVSLERKGGSPSPTAPAGPVVMVGKLGV